MDELVNRKFVGRLIISVLTDEISVLDAVKRFPESNDKSIECAYHALMHLASDEDIRRYDIEYREAQDEYLESVAQLLIQGKALPQNIINEYLPYYKGFPNLWKKGINWCKKEFMRFINIS